MTDATPSLNEYFSTVTHDLKAPLSSIMGFASLLADPRCPEARRMEFARNILRACENQLLMIDNIGVMKDVDGRGLVSGMSDFSLADLLLELEDLSAPYARRSGIAITVACPPEAWVTADRRRIRQVIFNLLSNALQETPEGGSVSMTVTEPAWRIEISDTGPGIAAEHLPLLFQKFTRLPGRRVRAGLGLYVVEQLLRLHDSGIELQSTTGTGTRAAFSLMAAAAPAAVPVKTGRILMAGLDAEASGAARAALQADGHAVDVAGSGLEALQKLDTSPPQVLVLGTNLPDITAEDVKLSMPSSIAVIDLKSGAVDGAALHQSVQKLL